MRSLFSSNRTKCIVATLCAVFLSLHADAGAAQSIDTKTLSEQQVTVLDLSKPAESGTPSDKNTGKTAGKTFLAATIMNAPLQQLCSIIQDYPQYPQFMPNTADTRVMQIGDATFIDLTLSLPLGKSKKYRLQMESKVSEQSCRLAWKLVPSGLRIEDTIADTVGYWQLSSHPTDSRKTVVEYQVYADPGPVPFGFGWIVDMMSKRSLPRTLEALRERAGTQQVASQ
jgi:hypothetical protein